MSLSPRALVPALILSATLALTSCSTPSPAAESASPAAPSSAPTSAAPASPTPTPTASAASFASCDEMITAEFRDDVAQNGWVGWNMVGEEIGHSPFDQFPDGAPTGQLSCRFGKGPEVATDNVLDLAWAPISGDAARAAQEALQQQGFQRIDVADGIQWSVRADDGWADDEGWGQTYLFTDTDVRWAMIRDQLGYINPAA